MKKDKINFIASVEPERISNIQAIADALKNRGALIKNILPSSGVISGSVASDLPFSQLKVDGIRNIEPDRNIDALEK